MASPTWPSSSAHLAATRGLGETRPILDNTYKQIASGLVIHPIIDACLQLHRKLAAYCASSAKPLMDAMAAGVEDAGQCPEAM